MSPFPPFPFTAPHKNWTSGSFQYLLTCQQGWCLQTQGMCNLRARLEGRRVALSANPAPADRHAIHNMPPLKTLGFTLGFTAGAGNLAGSAPMAHCSTLKVHSAVLAVSQIINSTHHRFAFHARYFEHRPNNILRLGDATMSWAHLCMREGKRSQQIKSVPWLLTCLV